MTRRVEYRWSHQGAHADEYDRVYKDRLPAVFWRETEMPLVETMLARALAGLGADLPRIHLDLATGTQRLRPATRACGDGWSFVGMDIAPDMLRKGSAHALAVADVTELPVASQSVGLVTCFRFVLNASDEAVARVVHEAERVLAPSGLFLFNVHALPISLVGLKRRFWSTIGLAADGVRSTVEVEACASQLRVRERRRLGVLPITGRIPGGALARRICAADRRLASRPLGQAFAGQEIVLMVKEGA